MTTLWTHRLATHPGAPRQPRRHPAALGNFSRALTLPCEASPQRRSGNFPALRRQAYDPATRPRRDAPTSPVSSLKNGMISAMERKKTGRPSRGERSPVNFYLPTAFKKEAMAHAQRRGLSFTDLLGELLEREIGLPYQPQEGLPLNKAS